MQRLTVDALIDSFVVSINQAARQRIREEDIPLQLRQGGARYGLYYSWNIQRFGQIYWIDPLEAKLRVRFPPSFRSLISRYLFPSFEVSSIVLLGNTGHALYNEMSQVIVREHSVAKALIAAGFIQFARQNSGDFDPVCFDTNRPNPRGEYPVVQVSYQQALLQKPQVVADLSPSFATLVELLIRETVPPLVSER